MTIAGDLGRKATKQTNKQTMGKLINRIPGSCLLISSLPGSALRTHVESLAMSTSVLKALPGKLDIKRHKFTRLGFENAC